VDQQVRRTPIPRTRVDIAEFCWEGNPVPWMEPTTTLGLAVTATGGVGHNGEPTVSPPRLRPPSSKSSATTPRTGCGIGRAETGFRRQPLMDWRLVRPEDQWLHEQLANIFSAHWSHGRYGSYWAGRLVLQKWRGSTPIPALNSTTIMPRSLCLPADYAKSQSVVTLPHPPPVAAQYLVQALLDSESRNERERLGSALLDTLGDSFGLPPCRLTVADRAQTHSTDVRGRLVRKTYGYYRCRIPRPGALPERCGIRIYHRTAIRTQVLAPGAFTSTLIHEWIHHFDFTGLLLNRSPHTRGFYARLRSVAQQLGVTYQSPIEPGAETDAPSDGG